jgi:membrane-associated PAP2 superfamily phosphatase
LKRPARQDAAVALAALAALLLWELSGWDLSLSRWYGSASGFAWRDAWLTSTLLHEGGRALAWALMALLVVDAVRPLVRGPARAARWRGIAMTLACLLVVPTIKRATHSSCPWDLAEFGGIAAYVPHWIAGVADGGPGHCFPSGHAVAAFGFLSGYFVLRDVRPRVAHAWLAAVCVLGLVFGWAQLARGAHYLSHTLWSAWLCWLICTLADGIALRPRRAALRVSA